MDEKERNIRILELRSSLNLKKAEIDYKQLELESISRELFKTEWLLFTWGELESWLKTHRPKSNYQDNPIVMSGHNGHIDYCRIASDGELQIGAYYNNDRFPRGCDLYVTYDFRKWR